MFIQLGLGNQRCIFILSKLSELQISPWQYLNKGNGMYWFEYLDKLIKVTPKKNATLHSACTNWFPKKVALIQEVNGRGSRWRSTNDHHFFPHMNQFSLTMIGRGEQELFSQNINHPLPWCNQPWLELLSVTVLLFFSPKTSNPYPFLKNKSSTNIQYVPSTINWAVQLFQRPSTSHAYGIHNSCSF